LLHKQLESFENGEIHPVSPEPIVYYAAEDRGSSQVSSGLNASRAIVIARPTRLAPHVYEEVSKAYSRTVHSVLTGEKNASDAASELENDLVKITGLHPGLPVRE
jgi:hypothetical protein